MSPLTNVATIAASLIKASRCRARAPRLSRRAATDLSHGRKPVGRCRFEWSPVGAKESHEICRPYGAYRRIGRNHGLAPVAKICRRSAALIGCASCDVFFADPGLLDEHSFFPGWSPIA